jgi:hypothetical protein
MSNRVGTPKLMNAQQVLEREFLEIRAKLLELAASFDRLDRGEGDIIQDVRLGCIREGLEVLAGAGPGRAEAIQMIFSREYHPSWREEHGVSRRSG